MSADALHAHLRTGRTTVARAWAVTRRDGVRFGFTDHDRDLAFDGLVYRAETGLSAKALQQQTGLSVDNTEAMGALTDAAIREEDIAAGRFDGAEVVAWLVNWADVAARKVVFRGHIGEIRRGAGAFHAELRSLTEGLNQPFGRVYQTACDAVLGDAACGVDLTASVHVHEGPVLAAEERRLCVFSALPQFETGWFLRGRLQVLSGAAKGLGGSIKRDGPRADGTRAVEIWEPLRADIAAGDVVRITAGCDKRFDTCRFKFNNVLNFRGFPDVPEEDWITVQPGAARRLDGGSRR